MLNYPNFFKFVFFLNALFFKNLNFDIKQTWKLPRKKKSQKFLGIHIMISYFHELKKIFFLGYDNITWTLKSSNFLLNMFHERGGGVERNKYSAIVLTKKNLYNNYSLLYIFGSTTNWESIFWSGIIGTFFRSESSSTTHFVRGSVCL